MLIVNNYGFCSCGIETRVRHMLKSHRQFNGALRAKGRSYSEGLMVVFYAQSLRREVSERHCCCNWILDPSPFLNCICANISKKPFFTG